MMKSGIAKFSANQMPTMLNTIVMPIERLGKTGSSGKQDCVFAKGRCQVPPAEPAVLGD